ncbi:hypothetical protein [Paenibacillus naphthalenovorans]|uniref:Uncharacterized protein n=1 Tax=Paenibacillus naphthalenovorans TaxID=162209 RepID=A0A0U2U7P1_9BACL|nr:hypothetical protein [Paenibacillus naphthalenovorans]ALS22200.1 hypothetical protein IJ22_18260 [Paenibacillus naphthalenovorans]
MDIWKVEQINREDWSGKNNAVSIKLVDNEYRDSEAYIKWDGCIDFRQYSNGYSPDSEHSKEKADNCDYIHICDIDKMIEKLQAIKKVAEEYFSKEDFEAYWNTK